MPGFKSRVHACPSIGDMPLISRCSRRTRLRCDGDLEYLHLAFDCSSFACLTAIGVPCDLIQVTTNASKVTDEIRGQGPERV